MSFPPIDAAAGTSSSVGIKPLLNPENPDIDELSPTVEDPSLGQLSLFKSIFGVGVSLARYVVNDPLWPILAAAGLPCSHCIRSKKEAHFRYFARKCSRDLAFARGFLEIHGDPARNGSSGATGVPTALAFISWARTFSFFSCVDSSHAGAAPEGEGTSDYRRVVLVLCPPPVPDLEVPPHLPEAVRPGPEVSVPSSARTPSRSQGSGGLRRRVVPSGSSEQFAPPNAVEDLFRTRINTPPMQQRSQESLRPYPRSQATSALKAENDRLKAEVEELRGLLTQARSQTSTLTSLLRDTSSSLDVCSKELEASRQLLEEVAVERMEYQRVLTQFRAIEVELPEPHSEDLVTRFHIVQSEVVVTKEAARKQKQEIAELYRLEELEDMVCRYRDRAHVAEELIRQYPEDEGLYEVELPSLSDLQRKLDASEALVHRLATFAHRLYTADPANLLHYHNRYVGGLLEAVTLLSYRGSTHTPDRLPSIVKLVLDYLTQARFTHGELHLRSISSLLYYYSNAADREMLSHSRFPSHDTFLTAAQHAGYVNARSGSLEPPLHRRCHK
ncbi:hypothetical protein F5879DRAFT_927979, partial [Lentinula edodes]